MGVPAHFSHGMVLLDGTPRRGGTSSLFRYMVKVKVFYMMDKSLDFIWFPLHMTVVWYLARGVGVLAPNDAIDVCISKHQSVL